MSQAKIELLFIDDEPQVLNGLRRQLHQIRDAWSCRFAESGEEALRMLRESPADAVVCDMRMPGMDGAQFLNEVRKHFPSTLRFILSGQTDQGQMLAHIGSIHQFLQKPCDPAALKDALNRSLSLRDALTNETLQNSTAYLDTLPVLESSYQQLIELLNDEDAYPRAIAELIQQDIGLSTKLIQMVNSAFYGIPRTINSVQQAVNLLGLTNIRNLVLSAKVFDHVVQGDGEQTKLQTLWHHSVRLGDAAAEYAQQAGLGEADVQNAQLAGAMSLTGRAVMMVAAPEVFQSADPALAHQPLALEQDAFGVNYTLIGAYLLGLWAFDTSIVEAVAHHLNPGAVRELPMEHPLHYVHLAHCKFGDAVHGQNIEPNQSHLQQVGLGDAMPEAA